MVPITQDHINRVKRLAERVTLSQPNRPNWIYEELISAGLETLSVESRKFDPKINDDSDGYMLSRVKLRMIDTLRQQPWYPPRSEKSRRDRENAQPRAIMEPLEQHPNIQVEPLQWTRVVDLELQRKLQDILPPQRTFDHTPLFLGGQN